VSIVTNRFVHLAWLRLGTAFCLDVATHIAPQPVHKDHTTFVFQSLCFSYSTGLQMKAPLSSDKPCSRRTESANTPPSRHMLLIQLSSFIRVFDNSWNSVTANRWVSGSNTVTNKLNGYGSGLTKSTADSGDTATSHRLGSSSETLTYLYRNTGQSVVHRSCAETELIVLS
jgi:hypothetical protein